MNRLTLFMVALFSCIFLIDSDIQAQEQHELELRSDALVLPRTLGSLVDNPIEGMVIFNAETKTLFTFNGDSWEEVGGGFAQSENVVHQSFAEPTSAFIFGREDLPGEEPSGGPISSNAGDSGTFFFFNEDSGAFRGGELDGSYDWAPENLGGSSFAYGKDVRAQGEFSTALGWETRAIGFSSIASGEGSDAIGQYAIAMGFEAEAIGNESTSIGSGTLAHGENTTAIGTYNDPLVVQACNAVDRPVLIVGNGTSNAARSNAMVVRQSGSVGIGRDGTMGQLSIKQRTSNADNAGLRLISSDDNISWEIRHTVSGDNLRFRAFDDRGSAGRTVEIRRSDGAYIVLSDMRLKKDISAMTDQLEKIVSLAPSTYRWKDHVDPSNPSIGVIAQEVEELFPYLVHTNEDGYKMVNYDGLGVLAIQAIKEQQMIIASQNKMLVEIKEAYDAEITALETRISRLESKN